jgi:hypothetical protein
MTWREKAVILTLYWIFSPLYWGFVVSWMWFWFIVPINQNIPIITVVWGWGIGMFARSIIPSFHREPQWMINKRTKKDNEQKLWDGALLPFFILCFGWIAQYLMNNFGW